MALLPYIPLFHKALVLSGFNTFPSTISGIKPGCMFSILFAYFSVIPDEITEKYANKILNIHPGLIPDIVDGKVLNPDNTKALWNKGMYGNKAIQNFLDQKATYAGSSLHFLTNEFDFGPVLGKTFEKIEPDDTVESLYARLKKKENELYVEVLEKLCKTS